MVVKAKLQITTNTKKRKPSKNFQNLYYYFIDYCNLTTIHGFKYFGERKRSFVEKIFWLIIVIISLYICIVCIIKIYYKWETSPVIVTIATSQTPIWKIPFPSVTICPQIKATKKTYNFTKNFLFYYQNNKSDLDEGYRKFEYMSLVCPTIHKKNMHHNRISVVDENALDFLLSVAPKFDEVILSINWLGKEYRDAFKSVITSDGSCYAFNLLDRKEIYTDLMHHHKVLGVTNELPSKWSLEKGYFRDADLDAFPRRTFLSGDRGGLDITFFAKNDDVDALCAESVRGFKVYIQHPAQIPGANLYYFRVSLNQDTIAVVKPNIISTSEELKTYSPIARQCYFLREKRLRYFKSYDQKNCLSECLANYTLNFCDCVGFYMPRKNSTPICGPGLLDCMLNANVAFLTKEVTLKIEEYNKAPVLHSSQPYLSSWINYVNAWNAYIKSIERSEATCDCLPSCNSLEFDVETSQADWDWRATYNLFNDINNINDGQLSRLRVFFKDMQFITSERKELYGPIDFWANFGGLLSLFTGFSFISLVEISYFATLRLFCNCQRYGKRHWSGVKELTDEATNDRLEQNARDLEIY